MSSIGFVILVNPINPLSQTERLIATLNRMFDHPLIACHHDFGQNPRFIDNLPVNVKLVQPHVATKWADFSCVEATVKALRLLYSGEDDAEWFVYLSGSDYPIKPASTILDDLKTGSFDGYIEHAVVSEGDLAYPPDPSNLPRWHGNHWLKHCHKLYCTLRVDVPSINRYLRFRKRTFWLEHPIFTNGRLPFTAEFKCFAGEVWFSANHRCARRILDFYDNDVDVADHYRKTLVPEESYFQTVLANAPDLKLSQDYLRYVDWTGGGSNPKVLTLDDLPQLVNTGAHFARKFDDRVDVAILDELDQLIG